MKDNYALVVLPSKDVSDIVDKYRQKYARFTSYVIPPHITLVPPFFIKSGIESKIISILNDEYEKVQPFHVLINKVDYFEGTNNVAYFKPDVKSSIKIKDLVIKAADVLDNRISLYYDDYNFQPENIVPHMTIAEKLPQEKFSEIKLALNNVIIDFSFQVSSVYLFRQLSGANEWEESSEIRLKNL